MSDLITRCPKCSTSFKIQRSHLDKAKGAVRCGSCLSIFNAKEHLINDEQGSSDATGAQQDGPPIDSIIAPEPSAPNDDNIPPKSELIESEDDLSQSLISDDDDDVDFGFDENVFFAHSASEDELNLFEKKIDEAEHEEDGNTEDDDESWALSLLAEEGEELDPEDHAALANKHKTTEKSAAPAASEHESTEQNQEPPSAALSEDEWKQMTGTSFRIIDDDELDEALIDDNFGEVDEKNIDDDDTGLAREEEHDNAPEPSHLAETGEHLAITTDELCGIENLFQDEKESEAKPEPEEDDDDFFYQDDFDPGHTDPSLPAFAPPLEHSGEREIVTDKQETHDEALGFEPFEQDFEDDEPAPKRKKNRVLGELEPEPLEFLMPRNLTFWHAPGFWLLLNLILLSSATAQLAYFKFDDWSRNEKLRPYYLIACEVIGCDLPALKDLHAIRIESMVVLDHPEKKGMLLVDATLMNTAKFEQPFPELKISFSTVNHAVLSEAVFSPSQYVGGELAGRNTMPPRHPIHITLDIADPGADAVNYQISVVKP
ncbi:zinc-ribbon and DUF3426 domain-containing protein [Agaribacterium haliotis]|uniref:zinc-ribbon and DUF3426 domain-containing protein n=1 Tax=Agaribacterium haliotis TaxID=2013869 RepID=UPI000BB53C14|nr:zinc-ribbon and DUF3426 domain-containing protein [Agaribacterium haliotis]